MTELDVRQPSAELYAALAAVQAELPEVKKTRTAKVEKDGRLLYTYDYADLADVSAAIMPILGKHGLAFTALPGHWPDGKFGLRYYLMHEGGASLEGFYEIADQGGMQMVGGRITYARRYCLCAVTGVAAEEDVDARGDSQTRSARRQPASQGGDQQPARTAQRKQRGTNASPAPAAFPPADQSGAGEALPPLPGEEETPDDPPGSERHKKLIGSVQGQFKRLGFTDEMREERLTVAAELAEVAEIASLNDLTPEELSPVADTLARCRNRDALTALLVAKDKAKGGGDDGE